MSKDPDFCRAADDSHREERERSAEAFEARDQCEISCAATLSDEHSPSPPPWRRTNLPSLDYSDRLLSR